MAPPGKTNRTRFSRSLALLAVALSAWLLWPAETLARALVRFIHALPGVGAVTVDTSSGGVEQRDGFIAFAQATPWHRLRSGHFRWSLIRDDKVLTSGTATVGSGAYDMVLLSKQPPGVLLGVYRDRSGHPGTSLVRVIHAAPQLGSPALRLDSHIFRSSLNFTDATPYLAVKPGVYALSAVKAGDSAPLVSLRDLRLKPDVSYSELILGSAGRRLRWVTVTDRGAPLTRSTRQSHPGPASHQGHAGPAGSVIVRSGDSLWTIAAHHLGRGTSTEKIARVADAIWRLNAARIGTGDPSLIFPGQRIVFPASG